MVPQTTKKRMLLLFSSEKKGTIKASLSAKVVTNKIYRGKNVV